MLLNYKFTSLPLHHFILLGRRGSTGSSGPKGNDGKIGVKGERGIQGPK